MIAIVLDFCLKKHISKSGLKRRDEKLFLKLLIKNLFFTEIAFLIFAFAYSLDYFLNPIYISFIYVVVIFESAICFLAYDKPKFLGISYTGENRHLFSKYISLLELSTTCAIAFLIGCFPSIFSYLSLENTEIYYLINISLVYLSCVSYSLSRLLKHTHSVWVANNEKTKRKLRSINRHNRFHKAKSE